MLINISHLVCYRALHHNIYSGHRLLPIQLCAGKEVIQVGYLQQSNHNYIPCFRFQTWSNQNNHSLSFDGAIKPGCVPCMVIQKYFLIIFTCLGITKVKEENKIDKFHASSPNVHDTGTSVPVWWIIDNTKKEPANGIPKNELTHAEEPTRENHLVTSMPRQSLLPKYLLGTLTRETR